MALGNFILDSLKEKFGEDEESEGFDDLNYAVGNSSGFDIGQTPSPMGERIGYQAQRGGSVQEITVSNPGTFQIEREAIYDTVEQLGIDISLHSDATTGFTSAYRTRSQAVGYDIAHDYFKRYLEQVASFKKEKEERELDFNIQRINPHISTSAIPPLSERMAQDVGVDPFGFEMPALDSRGEEKNIYRNSEFMKRFYRTFILHEVDDPWQIYRLFERFSPEFRQKWREAQKEACDAYWDNVTDFTREDDRVMGKISLIQSARMADQGMETAWLDIINEGIEFSPELQVADQSGNTKPFEDLSEVPGIQELRGLSQAYYSVKNNELSETVGMGTVRKFDLTDDQIETIRDRLEDALDKLWKGNGGDEDGFRMSIDAKVNSLTGRLDIQETQIWERAQGEEYLEEAAEELMGKNLDYLEEDADIGKPPEEKYWDLVDTLLNSFEQALWKESSIFYFVMPAWMKVADRPDEDENSWEAPEFLWETVVERRHGEVDFLDPEDYFRKLEEDQEFRMDVAAAVGALYAWGHFTQRKSEFKIEREQYMEDTRTRETWVNWMNRFGIGVNMEAFVMQRDEYYKVWRPKDIVAAAHAINMTARKQLGSIHPELDGKPVKFTIDLEHTASFGVDPMKEMDILTEQEEELAKKGTIDADPEKPLAKILREWHLVKPGLETKQGESRHGPWIRGDAELYESLYRMVDAGFCRNMDEPAYIMFEVASEYGETTYMARIAMDLIALGVTPEELDPANVPADGKYKNRKQALMARFFGMDESSVNQEWAKIEEHAFDPLKGLLEADDFDYTWSSKAAMDNDNRPGEWQNEEYQ